MGSDVNVTTIVQYTDSQHLTAFQHTVSEMADARSLASGAVP